MEVKPEKVQFEMSEHDNGTDMRRSPLVGRQSTEKSEEKRGKQTDGQTEITTHPHPPASVEIFFKLNQTNSDWFISSGDHLGELEAIGKPFLWQSSQLF